MRDLQVSVPLALQDSKRTKVQSFRFSVGQRKELHRSRRHQYRQVAKQVDLRDDSASEQQKFQNGQSK